ncbi:MAG: iron-sulfur cluster assembly scaffold protein, partial [Sphaerochaetaceae bacterium]
MDDHVKTKRVPTNFGPLADATSNARSRGNSGVTFEYWVKGNFDEIKDVTFTSDGDETSLTIGSTLAENATGRSFEQARLIKAGDLSEKESD